MPVYDQQSLIDLKDRTQYECWFLEAAYEIVDDPLFPEWPDQLIYPPSGGDPPLIAHGRGNIVLGDWRPHFLEAGAPLLFVTTFKLLDMLVEWVLEQNGHASTHRFQQKISTLKTGQLFPPLISSRAWLLNRVVALYEQIEPLRGTIVHARHFKTSEGDLTVSGSKQGIIGPTVTVAQKDIRAAAVFVISLLHYLDGTWQMDAYREKVLRRTLDDLGHLHHLPSLGQQPPSSLTVRVYAIASQAQWVDLGRIRDDIGRLRPGHDVVFDVRLVTVAPDGSGATAYRLPWAEVHLAGDRLVRAVSELSSYTADLPSDVDPGAVARALVSSPNNQTVAG